MSALPDEPIWLTVTQVKMLHAETLRLFGGAPGLRDEGLLQNAIAKPRQSFAYGDAPSIFHLAAAYGYGLAKNHAFVDGNKRIALLATRAFLFRNGYAFNPDPVETVTMIEGVAGGTVSQDLPAAWLQKHTRARGET
jgi:death-on-curing protein